MPLKDPINPILAATRWPPVFLPGLTKVVITPIAKPKLICAITSNIKSGEKNAWLTVVSPTNHTLKLVVDYFFFGSVFAILTGFSFALTVMLLTTLFAPQLFAMLLTPPLLPPLLAIPVKVATPLATDALKP